MQPRDLDLLNSVSTPTLHPDGDRCVVAVTRPDFRADAYVGQLWSLPLDGRGPRRITRGFRDTDPLFSPDGQLLGFLRAAQGGRAQLHITDAAGGEPLQLTDQPLGVSWFRFSPDSRQVVFAARVPEAGRYGTLDGVPAPAEDPRLVTRLNYRMNGVGYLADKPLQIFLLELPDLQDEPWVPAVGRVAQDLPGADAGEGSGLPTARQLTHEPTDHATPVFSADGSRILFTASLPAGRDGDLVTDAWSLDLAGGGLQRLTNADGAALLSVSHPVESPDGSQLYYLAGELGENGLDFVARNTALYTAPAGNPESIRRLTDVENVDLAEGPVVPVDSGALVFNRTRGRVELLHVSADGGIRPLAGGDRVVIGAAAAGDTVAIAYTDADTAGAVAVVGTAARLTAPDPDGAGNQGPTGHDGAASSRPGEDPAADERTERVLADFSTALRERTRVVPPEELVIEGPDGYPVHGWLVRPAGDGPHPVLLNIHGGPFAQYTGALFDEAQVYAAAGYAVLMCNPRGSAGYGQKHGRVIKEAMGTVDMTDVLAFLDGCLGLHPEILDPGRVGIMGGSYGGYLTAWITAHEHRFAAAVVERGFLDPVSFTGSADIGWFFGGQYTGTDPERVAGQSPMAKVGQVRTPTLVLHSEDDLRCPVEQAQRYFAALRMNGIPAELLLFPGENHELSRSGTPWHRRQRFEHILRWWHEHLPVSGADQHNAAMDVAAG